MSNETNKLNSFFTHEVTLVKSDQYANQNGECIICKGDEMTKVKDSTNTSLEKCASIAAQPLSPGRFIASTHLVVENASLSLQVQRVHTNSAAAFESSRIIKANTCGYVFHAHCLRTWLESKVELQHERSCPLCRTVLVKKHWTARLMKALRSAIAQGLVSVALNVVTTESNEDGNNYDTLGDTLGMDFWVVDA
jgi:hypothetical protein